jgi:hypothetical protein
MELSSRSKAQIDSIIHVQELVAPDEHSTHALDHTGSRLKINRFTAIGDQAVLHVGGGKSV